MTDRLLASALVHALHPERSIQESAAALARQADNRAEALDRALAYLLRRTSERPTTLTERAAETLRAARRLAVAALADAGGPAHAAPGRDLPLGVSA